MFKLRFRPTFAKQRREFLEVQGIPKIVLPPILEECVTTTFATENQGRLLTLSSSELWLACFRLTKPLWARALLFALLSALCATASTLSAMNLLKPGTSVKVMLFYSTLYAFCNLLSQVGIFKGGRIRAWVSLGAESFLAGMIAQKLLSLSPLTAETQSSGNLKTLITSDTKNVGQFLDNAARNLIPTLTAFLVVLPLLIHFSGKAGVIGVLVMLTLLPLCAGLNRVSEYFQGRGLRELDRLTSLIGEWVKNIRLIRYLSWEETLAKDVSTQLKRYLKFASAEHVMACLIFGLSTTWWMVAVASVAYAAHTFHGGIELSHFFASLWLLTFLAGYLSHLPNTIRHLGMARPSMKRIAKFLTEAEWSSLLKPDTSTLPLGNPTHVIFDQVHFRYPDGKIAIQDLSLTLDLRVQQAVLGEVACGKSTFLKLLCGEYPPTQGSISIVFNQGEKRNLWEASVHAEYRKHLAWVPQDPFVSSDLLSVNISLEESGNESAILEAAYFAELEADLHQFPRGIHEELGESGINLSGGQKQRLNLARAFHSKRPILILDDTLSALDTKTEVKVLKRLHSLAAGFVLVTHRTKELQGVARVLVFKEGTLVEEGSPEVLADSPSSYYSRILSAYAKEESDV